MIDPAKVERIGPEYWRNSQLSVAKYYGAAIINGKKYILDLISDELVREDIYRQEMKDKKKQAKVAAAEKKKYEGIKDQLLLLNNR